MSAEIVIIAEAVKDVVTGATLSQPVTVERVYLPEPKLQELSGILVTVVPKTKVCDAASRGGVRQRDYQIDIGIRQRLAERTNAEIDAKMLVVDEIESLFASKQLSGYPTATCIKVENVPIISDEHLNQLNQFTSLLTLTFRTIR